MYTRKENTYIDNTGMFRTVLSTDYKNYIAIIASNALVCDLEMALDSQEDITKMEIGSEEFYDTLTSLNELKKAYDTIETFNQVGEGLGDVLRLLSDWGYIVLSMRDYKDVR